MRLDPLRLQIDLPSLKTEMRSWLAACQVA